VGREATVDATFLCAFRTDLEHADSVRSLQLEYEKALATNSAEIEEMDAASTGAGFEIESTVDAYGDDPLTQGDLAQINRTLAEVVDSQVSLQATVLMGQRTELQASE
jgi:hypothetical protein